MKNLEKIAWNKLNGLIPAIIQDYVSKEVLMLAFMNKEALELSLNTGYAHFYSRSKERIWKKGEQSGHIQKIHQIFLDCDKDSVLLEVEQVGVACHTGNKTCFFQLLEGSSSSCEALNTHLVYGVVDRLYHILLERKDADSKTSYTASLYQKGENSIAKKIVEEAAEFGFSIKDRKKEDIVYEAADLLYHSLVGLAYCDVNPDLIRQELIRRFGLSGIKEKQGRGK
ncbi:MAG: bifunctional phosphoribosyl-AMP cyclohydrolase/phosphoribosyl-ATP diphosphatase HisIE [Helicobacter sp.]|nr:bifunctional phosphoribosyl-AMP cyclohydrolase/phosphoribosyl-ATP diphosphatase HisIE [Helicobacter sp.]